MPPNKIHREAKGGPGQSDKIKAHLAQSTTAEYRFVVTTDENGMLVVVHLPGGFEPMEMTPDGARTLAHALLEGAGMVDGILHAIVMVAPPKKGKH